MLDVAYFISLLLHGFRVNFKAVLLALSLLSFCFINLYWWQLDEAALYKVVFDAGSTGTRVHVFRFSSSKSSLRSQEDLALISIPLFAKIDGGISDYAVNVKGARPGLDELVSKARDAIPKSKWAETEAIFLATAGLRLLPANQASALLTEARNALARSGFKVGLVDTIDGKLEAKLMFTMTHFVTNTDQRAQASQMAIVDLGGGSVQLAYKSDQPFDIEHWKDPQSGEEARKYFELSSNRSILYLHSWLGYGLVAFRMKALELAGSGSPHPCVPTWTPPGTQYKYGEKSVHVVPGSSKSLDSCVLLVKEALGNRNDGQCRLVQDYLLNSQGQPGRCGLNGVWLGPSEPNSIAEWRLFSYIFDLAQEEGMVQPGVSEGSLSARDFMNSAVKHCQASGEGSSEKILWWKCVDLVYVSVLLTDGFKLDPDFPLRVTKHLWYKGAIELEAAWPLGAAIASIRNEL